MENNQENVPQGDLSQPVQPEQHSKIILLSVGLLIVLIVFGSFVLYSQMSVKAPVVQIPSVATTTTSDTHVLTPTVSTTSSVSTNTTNTTEWKTYVNSTIEVEIQYPATWKPNFSEWSEYNKAYISLDGEGNTFTLSINSFGDLGGFIVGSTTTVAGRKITRYTYPDKSQDIKGYSVFVNLCNYDCQQYSKYIENKDYNDIQLTLFCPALTGTEEEKEACNALFDRIASTIVFTAENSQR